MANERSDTMLGHPKGLYVLFFTELWERFSFYSMRGVLVLYMVAVVLAAREDAGGHADQVYGAYLGFVYSATFIGGMLADRLLGQRRAIYIGGTLMALAQFTLATHALLIHFGQPVARLHVMFFLGLALLAAGNGFFKPNISTIVGTLYTQGDARRDAAFTIFYMGINIGAFLAGFSGQIAEMFGWYLAFLLAGIGMICGLVIFSFGRKHLQGKGMPPPGATLTGRGRLRVPNVLLLVVGVGAFIPLAAYLISQPQWVQSLALWIAVPVLAYLLWEGTRAARGVGQGGAADWITALLAAAFGFMALAANALSLPLVVWIAPLCIMLAALFHLIWRASRSQEGARMIVIVVLCCFSMMFWGFFELAGSTVTRFTNQIVDRIVFDSEKVSHEFSDVVNDGQVGLGTSHGQSRFDRLEVDSTVGPGVTPPSAGAVSIPYTADFSADGPAAREFQVISGTWNVNNNAYEVGGLPQPGDNGISVLDIAPPLPEVFEIAVRIEPVKAENQDENGFVIFDYQGPNAFKFAGFRADGDYWTIGHYDGSWVDDARLSEPINTGARYHLRISLDSTRATLSVGGMELKASFLNQIINPLLIIVLSIPFSVLWVWLDRRRLEPSSPLKFALGLAQLGLGFLMLYLGTKEAGETGKCNLLWLFLAYLFHTTGELCLSPVGLSMVTKLSPARLVGMFMGVWFLSSALANVFAGRVGGMTSQYGFGTVFFGIVITTGSAAVLLVILTPLLKKLMHGVK